MALIKSFENCSGCMKDTDHQTVVLTLRIPTGSGTYIKEYTRILFCAEENHPDGFPREKLIISRRFKRIIPNRT